MHKQRFQYWVWRLRAGGLPPAHVAFILDAPDTAVAAVPVRQSPLTPLSIRLITGNLRADCRAQNSTKILRLAMLGYSAEKIGGLVNRQPAKVASYLRRMTAADGHFLPAPRTVAQQRVVNRNRKRRAERAAELAAAKAGAWPRCRDLDSPAELPTGQAAAELASHPDPAAAPAPLPEPTRWHQTADPRTRFGECHGRAKLTRAIVEECRRLHHTEGVSFYRLGRQFGVAPNTIAYAVKGTTWGAPEAAELPEPALPPAAKVKPERKPREKRHRWRTTGDRRRTDAD
jgi:hypothetical protein